MQEWCGAYRGKTGAWVVYDAVGAGRGVQNLLDGTSGFAVTDAPLSDSQLAHARSVNREAVHIPQILGGVVPVYNVPEVPTGLRFTGPLLADIFLGKVKSWNDAAVRAANPDVPLPNTPIVVVPRGDPSGTTYLWTDYLAKCSPEWKAGADTGTGVTWPVGLPATGSKGVATAVGRKPGAIGFVELSFALTKKLTYGAVKNRGGRFVSPSPRAVSAAALAALPEIPDDLRFTLTDAPGEESFPVSGSTWAVVLYPLGGKPNPQVLKFLEWVAHDGQGVAAPHHAATLPPELVRRIDTQLARFTR